MNPHFHMLALDGVFTQTPDGDIAFHEAPVPKQKDVTVLCSVVRLRVLELLKDKGLLPNDADIDPFATDEPLLAAIVEASATSRIATGDRAGKPVIKLATLPAEVTTRKRERTAQIDGFNLHAGAALAASDRQALERVLR